MAVAVVNILLLIMIVVAFHWFYLLTIYFKFLACLSNDEKSVLLFYH